MVTYQCMQGSGQGRDADDVLWIGEKDEGGSFLWKGKRIHDVYFRYLNEGLQTIHVRCTVDVKAKLIVDWVVDLLANKLKMGDALEALQAGELEINLRGARINGETLVSSFPIKSLFLLSRGPLPDEYTQHKGCVWQCQHCGNADTKRGNIMRAKCKSKSGRHKFFFKDQQVKLGDHPSTKGGKPLYLPRDSQPAIAQP